MSAVATTLEHDPKAVIQFSNLVLGGEPTEFRLVHPKTGKTRRYYGPAEVEADTEVLAEYNIKKGFGVFAVINRLDPAVEQRIKKEYKSACDADVTGIRALFVDRDRPESTTGEALALLMAAPLPPSAIVQSSEPNKLHAYWLIDPADPVPVREFETLQTALITHFGGDSSCKNESRIMRVPGFLHTKGEPILSRIVEATGIRYTRAEMLEHFPDLREALEQEAERQVKRAEAAARAAERLANAPAAERDHARRYALAALRDESAIVASAQDGERNTKLNDAAFNLGQLLPTGALERSEVEDTLRAAAQTCGLDPHEIEGTIRSGIEAGIRKPRVIPPRQTRKGAPKTRYTKTSAPGDDAPAADTPDGVSEGPSGRPTVAMQEDEYLQTQAILEALHALNDPPEIFQQQLKLCEVVESNGVPGIRRLSSAGVRYFAQTKLELVQEVEHVDRKTGEISIEKKTFNPSNTVGSYLLSEPRTPFPELRGIVYAPHFSTSGDLVTAPGYSPSSKLYLSLGGFQPLPVPEQPTLEEVEAARDLILNDLLTDFPLVDAASKAHAVALGLLPFVRSMIDGPSPLHGIDATSPGTGKSLLVEILTFAATGLDPRVLSEGGNDDEWRKRITSTLLTSPPTILVDNINRKLDSGALSAAITARVWSDRRLGHTENVDVPNLAVWTVTANNLTTSQEIARRLLWIKLDAGMERPWERNASGFKHPKIKSWLTQNRHNVVNAFLVLVQNWLAKGRPPGERPLGGFEAWSECVGGILAAAGIDGFLGNTAELYSRADVETQAWRSFVQAWVEQLGQNEATSARLLTLAQAVELPGLGERDNQSQKIKLGRALTRHTDRVFAGYTIKKGNPDSHTKVQTWYLAPALRG